MRNLTVDIGNSRIKVSVFDIDEQIFSQVFDMLTADALAPIIDNYKVGRAIISSVTGYDYDYVTWLNEHLKTVILLSSSVKVPVKNGYGTPETLGMDRLAAVVGAAHIKPGAPLLVVDAGTAITYDYMSADSTYYGGNIAPGALLRLRSLNEHTDRLPLVDMRSHHCTEILGQNTQDAIWNGVVRGIAYEIEGYISDLKERESNLEIFFTGGDAFFFEKYIKSSIFVVANLTAIGLNAILNYNLN